MSDEPIPGYYMTRLVRGGPFVPVRIHFGAPILDNEEQDRAPIWVVTVDGKTDREETGPEGYKCRVALDVYQYWPFCGRFRITQGEYEYMLAKSRWVKEYAPDRPEASPREVVDFNSRKPVF